MEINKKTIARIDIKVLIILMFLLSAFTSVNAESKLFGKVVNSTNNHPIYAATIILKRNSFVYILQGISTTDSIIGSTANGDYEILDLSAGDYLLSVSKTGFEPIIDEKISIGENDKRTMDFVLRPKREYIKKCRNCKIEIIKGTALLEGTIEDKYSEFPITAASIQLNELESKLFRTKKSYLSSTTKDGYYGFYNIPKGVYSLTVHATGFRIFNDTMIVGEDDKVYKDIELKSIFEINIRPCDNCPAYGILIGKVNNYITNKIVTRGLVKLGNQISKVSDNGLFTFIRPPSNSISLTYVDSNFSTITKNMVNIYPKTVSLIDLQVTPNNLHKYFKKVSGTVTSNQHELEGVEVKLLDSPYSTITDENGMFSLDSVFADKYYVMMKKRGYKLIVSDIDLKEADSIVDLHYSMDKQDQTKFVASINGLVSDIDGGKVQGATVIIPSKNIVTTTDEKGNFKIDSLKIGTYTIKIHKEGFDTTYIYDMDLFNPEEYTLGVLLEKDYFKTMVAPQNSGLILGEVRAEKTNNLLSGVQLVLENSRDKYFTFSNARGQFVIKNINSGSYKMIISKNGYEREEEEGLEVINGVISRNDYFLETSDVKSLASMKVTGSVMKNSQGALLLEKKKSMSMDDAISSEEFKKAGGVSDAADAVKQITGVTLKDGKYVYIRGLGDRYVTTLFNGSPIPSPDPDVQAVPMDMFPASLIDNIIINKTFSPHMPGNFGGGLVNMKSKKFPDYMKIGGYVKIGYNAGETFDNMLSYDGGSTDWLGYDDGTRALPNSLKGRNQSDIPRPSDAPYPGDSLAQQVDSDAKSFNDIMYQTHRMQPLSTKSGFNFGNTYKLFGRKLGVQLNLSYKNSYGSITDGKKGFYTLTDNINVANNLNESYAFDYIQGSHSVLWGGLLSLDYELNKKNSFSFNYMYNQIGKDKATYYNGSHYNIDDNQRLETRVMKFTERSIGFLQFSGEHKLFRAPFMQDDFKLGWRVANSNTSQDEPDTRVFSDHYTIIPTFDDEGLSTGVDTIYTISLSMYPAPTRFFRSMEENSFSNGADITVPLFNPISENPLNIKLGYSYEKKERDFKMDKYLFYQKNVSYNGDIKEFFNKDNMGLIGLDTVAFGANDVIRNSYGQFVVKEDSESDDYKGKAEFPAAYLGAELPIGNRFAVSGGARYEITDMFVTNTADSGTINRDDILWNVSTVYSLFEDMKLRFSYGKTLVRPSIREFAPFSAVENPKEGAVTGNTDLKMTDIQNFDLRWEWYYTPSEIFSVGFFYKDLKNPIETVLLNENGETSWQNVDNAKIVGVELEFKKKIFEETLIETGDLRIGGNITLIKSAVDLDDDTYNDIIQLDPTASKIRVLQGQSPYVINALITYKYKPISTLFSLYYNVFGKKLSGVFIGATPNPYQEAEHILNFNVTQPFGLYTKVKFSAKNLLDANVSSVSNFKGKSYTLNSHSKGRSYSLSFTYTFDEAKIVNYESKRVAKFKDINVNKRERRLY